MTLQTFARFAPGRKLDRARVAYSRQLDYRSRFGVAMVNHRERGGIQMHLLRLLTVAAFIVSGSVAVATSLWVDLGPTGVVHNNRTVDAVAPNLLLAGLYIVLDFSFLSG